MKRYVILACAVLMQMCLGATYSWSIYVDKLKGLAGLTQGVAQLPFSLFYFAFPLTLVLAGTSLLPRFGPRCCAVAGGLLFGCGWLLAMLGRINFTFTVLGIGLLGGIGVGVCYLVPITVCIRWFPKQKGLVTGVAVAGFGGGAALVSQLGGFLLAGYGMTPFQVFGILGLSFLFLASLSGLPMCYPPDAGSNKPAGLKASAFLRAKRFRVLYIAMFTGLAAGFAVNANLRQLYRGSSITAGITAVSLFALGNGLGRIIWGMIIDRTRSSVAIQANLVSQSIVLVVALLLASSTAGFLFVAAMLGFNYGGVLVVYATAVAHSWGDEHVAQIYGLLFSANILAALSPVVVGFGYDLLGSFGGPVSGLAVMMLLATVIVHRNAETIDAHSSLVR